MKKKFKIIMDEEKVELLKKKGKTVLQVAGAGALCYCIGRIVGYSRGLTYFVDYSMNYNKEHEVQEDIVIENIEEA